MWQVKIKKSDFRYVVKDLEVAAQSGKEVFRNYDDDVIVARMTEEEAVQAVAQLRQRGVRGSVEAPKTSMPDLPMKGDTGIIRKGRMQ